MNMKKRPSVYKIEDVRQLKVLWHPLRLRILEEMGFRGQATPTQIARALGESAPKIHYHVKELAKVGLVEEVETKPKGGVLEHYYRLVADDFQVSSDIGVKASDGRLGGVIASGIERVFAEVREAYTRQAERKAKAAPGADLATAFALSGSQKRLTKAEAEELAHRLGQVVVEFESSVGQGGEDGGEDGKTDGATKDVWVYGILTAVYPIRPAAATRIGNDNWSGDGKQGGERHNESQDGDDGH